MNPRRLSRVVATLLLTLTASLLAAIPSSATDSPLLPGDVDTSFGQSGRLWESAAGGDVYADMTVDSESRTVVVGHTRLAGQDIPFVMRLRAPNPADTESVDAYDWDFSGGGRELVTLSRPALTIDGETQLPVRGMQEAGRIPAGADARFTRVTTMDTADGPDILTGGWVTDERGQRVPLIVRFVGEETTTTFQHPDTTTTTSITAYPGEKHWDYGLLDALNALPPTWDATDPFNNDGVIVLDHLDLDNDAEVSAMQEFGDGYLIVGITERVGSGYRSHIIALDPNGNVDIGFNLDGSSDFFMQTGTVSSVDTSTLITEILWWDDAMTIVSNRGIGDDAEIHVSTWEASAIPLTFLLAGSQGLAPTGAEASRATSVTITRYGIGAVPPGTLYIAGDVTDSDGRYPAVVRLLIDDTVTESFTVDTTFGAAGWFVDSDPTADRTVDSLVPVGDHLMVATTGADASNPQRPSIRFLTESGTIDADVEPGLPLFESSTIDSVTSSTRVSHMAPGGYNGELAMVLVTTQIGDPQPAGAIAPAEYPMLMALVSGAGSAPGSPTDPWPVAVPMFSPSEGSFALMRNDFPGVVIPMTASIHDARVIFFGFQDDSVDANVLFHSFTPQIDVWETNTASYIVTASTVDIGMDTYLVVGRFSSDGQPHITGGGLGATGYVSIRLPGWTEVIQSLTVFDETGDIAVLTYGGFIGPQIYVITHDGQTVRTTAGMDAPLLETIDLKSILGITFDEDGRLIAAGQQTQNPENIGLFQLSWSSQSALLALDEIAVNGADSATAWVQMPDDDPYVNSYRRDDLVHRSADGTVLVVAREGVVRFTSDLMPVAGEGFTPSLADSGTGQETYTLMATAPSSDGVIALGFHSSGFMEPAVLFRWSFDLAEPVAMPTQTLDFYPPPGFQSGYAFSVAEAHHGGLIIGASYLDYGDTLGFEPEVEGFIAPFPGVIRLDETGAFDSDFGYLPDGSSGVAWPSPVPVDLDPGTLETFGFFPKATPAGFLTVPFLDDYASAPYTWLSTVSDIAFIGDTLLVANTRWFGAVPQHGVVAIHNGSAPVIPDPEPEPSGSSGGSGLSSSAVSSVEPLHPLSQPVITSSGTSLTCTVGEFTQNVSDVSVRLMVNAVADPAQTFAPGVRSATWPTKPEWAGASITCEVFVRAGAATSTTQSGSVTIPKPVTPTPTPTPTPTVEPTDSEVTAVRRTVRFASTTAAVSASQKTRLRAWARAVDAPEQIICRAQVRTKATAAMARAQARAACQVLAKVHPDADRQVRVKITRSAQPRTVVVTLRSQTGRA